jgi:hypothetical protein
MYASYFVLVAYASLFQGTLRDMKKSYKFSLILTFAVILGFILLMMLQGGLATQHNTTLYVSFLALVNLYLWLCAYLYSPAVDSLDDIQFKEARREHEHIMN